MKSRSIAAIAVGATLALSLTGCAFVTPQGIIASYAPSEGLDISSASGPVDIRNVLIVATKDGAYGNLLGAFVNATSQTQTVSIEVGIGSSAVKTALVVPAGKTISLGTADTPPIVISPLNAKPGSTVSVFFQSGDGQGVRNDGIPVLNGTLGPYQTLVPTPLAPAAPSSMSPTPTPTR